MNTSDGEFVRKALRSLGLTDVESKVYLFLSKRGTLKGSDIARNLKISKTQVYHILKSLQSKAWVESTAEFPARFTATSLAEALDSQAKVKREEAQAIETAKNEILAHWKPLDPKLTEFSQERFVIIEGRTKALARDSQMIEEATNEIKLILSGYPLEKIVSEEVAQVSFKKLKESNIQFKILTQVTPENFRLLNQTFARLSRQKILNQVKVRHIEDANFHCRLLIKDGQEITTRLTVGLSSAPIMDEEETSEWSNSPAILEVSNKLFDCLWADAQDLQEKLKEISAQQTS